MGAGAVHQANPKGNSMGLIMPLYTIGIVAFFVYTIMKVQLYKSIEKQIPIHTPIPNRFFQMSARHKENRKSSTLSRSIETGSEVQK